LGGGDDDDDDNNNNNNNNNNNGNETKVYSENNIYKPYHYQIFSMIVL
jgi:hypothetical protein